jgi:hypothetical protein
MGNFGDIMPVLDLEQPATVGSLTSDEIASWGRVFVDTVKSLTNRQVMIYTGDWFVEQYNDFGGQLSFCWCLRKKGEHGTKRSKSCRCSRKGQNRAGEYRKYPS